MDLDELCVNTIRTLSIDAVSNAKSGHPGAPLGCAAAAYVLWTKFLKHNPKDPEWPDRDRFVLSAGHASALLYSLLHLTGYDLSLEDIKKFRQWGSKTPGHPEAAHTPGVEVTTGPLGQGFGNAVGMAIAERYLAAHFNRPGFDLVDHYTYVLVSDGDMMEGISHEAASLAGHLGLGKLIALYADNKISLDGPTENWFTDDTAARFDAYGWQTVRVDDGNDIGRLAEAIEAARSEPDRPTLILCRTHIGYGSPLQDTPEAHGKPLDEEQLGATKKNLGWPEDEMFLVPDRAAEHFRAVAGKGAARQAKWQELCERYHEEFPDLAAEWSSAWSGTLQDGWDDGLPSWEPSDGPVATRNAAGDTLEVLQKNCLWLVGGDADLSSSTRTRASGANIMQAGDFAPQQIGFGVREHAMAAACCGIVRHGGLRAFGSTFLVFSDYARPSLRLAGMMRAPVVYQFTHDSIGVGEDGPTHQPVEHIAVLRAIPNWTVIRPADANEAREAWRAAIMNKNGPTAIICTRQKLPVMDRRRACAAAEELYKGAYVLKDAEAGAPDIILMASGSEVSIALEAQNELAQKGVAARVVSFPSWELFRKQPQDYRDSVLPPEVNARLAVEAASPMGWRQWVGDGGDVIGIDTFGASAPGEELMEKYGFTVDNIVRQALDLLGKK